MKEGPQMLESAGLLFVWFLIGRFAPVWVRAAFLLFFAVLRREFSW
jgi:hypothetical protein